MVHVWQGAPAALINVSAESVIMLRSHAIMRRGLRMGGRARDHLVMMLETPGIPAARAAAGTQTLICAPCVKPARA